MAEEAVSKNFIEQEIEKDLAEGVYDHVCTRFPPEPNGYLHIGHAKSILLNYGLAQKYNGTFHMRFDDTNPTKEKTEFVESIKADIKWLGADWGDHLYFASDYFDQMYEYAIKLIKKGKAYVCDLTADQIREYRGTLTEPGKDSPYRDRSVEENLDLFEFAPGAHTPEEYGKYMIQRSGHFEYDPNLDEFYDYERYGLQHMGYQSGVFTDRGYIAYVGTVSLEELMADDPAESYQREQDFQMGGMT